MKTVFFVRHAKSSWKHLGLSDHDRPLNKRGIRDAPVMANVLKARASRPDLLLSSTAKRALSTATYFREELGMTEEQLTLSPQLYHAWPETIQSILQALPEEVNSVAVFAHNPGLTILANAMPGPQIDNVPTTAIIHSQCEIEEWKDWTLANSNRLAFWYPKMFI